MEHREQLESEATSADYSVAPAGHVEQNISPYPRLAAEAAIPKVPLSRRIGWDIGLALFGILATATLCQFPASQVGAMGWLYFVLGGFGLLFALWGHGRGDLKAWHGFATLFWGACVGCLIFSKPAPNFDPMNDPSGRNPLAFSLVFCLVGMIVVGAAARSIFRRSEAGADLYEGLRIAWAGSFLFGTVAAVVGAMLYTNLQPFERTVWEPWLLSSGTLAAMLALWYARSRQKASVLGHIAMLFAPAAFAVPSFFALSTFRIVAEGVDYSPIWQTFLVFAVLQMVVPFIFRVKLDSDSPSGPPTPTPPSQPIP